MSPCDTRPKFFIRTFGCQMNVLDSEKVAGMLSSLGWSPVAAPEEADFILYNTCSVREKAARRVYSHLGRMGALKRARPEVVLGVMGCVAQQEGEEMLRRVKWLDLVVGTRRLHRLPELVSAIRERRAGRTVDTLMDDGPAPVEAGPPLRETSFRAFVTIMEGCDNCCSYCVVPLVRGRERCRPSRLVLDEIGSLAVAGVVEVVLLGQNVNSYRDPSGEFPDFASILEAASHVPGVRRLRFTTSHPKDFNGRVLDVMLARSNVCKFLHLPAQAGSDRVLAAMNRKYTRDGYLETVSSIRSSTPRVGLSSDFIVGFPGEDEGDFQCTMDLLRAVRYDSIFSFCYSPRPRTGALQMADDVPPEAKLDRLRRLQALQSEIQREDNLLEIGCVHEILVDGRGSRPGQMEGRTDTNKIVHFAGDVSCVGSFVSVRVTEAGAHSVRGERVSGIVECGA